MDELTATLVKMRLVVGYLGEKRQYAWWPSSFLMPAAQVFAAAVFPRTHLLARYHGVSEAARRVHDGHIGVGTVHHLFRLPDILEEKLHDAVRTDGELQVFVEGLANPDAALCALLGFASNATGLETPGPVQVGRTGDLKSVAAWRQAMACYAWAMQHGLTTFPYFAS
jgi:hypothetical protein